MLAPELKREINRLWDKFWSGGIANPLTAIEQIAYLIFMKRLEEADDEAKRRDKKHRSIFDGKNDPRRWSQFRHLGGEEMLKVVRDQVFPFIKEMGGSRMRDAVFVIPSPTMLQGAVEIIDKLFIPSRNADTLGDIYEHLLSEIQTAGKNGQFRTPRHIIRAIVQMVNPTFDGRRLPRICDPACGTSGFLVNSYLHIMAAHTPRETLEIEADGTPQRYTGEMLGRAGINKLRSNTFYGFDFDPTMVRIGWMNMIQHGLTDPHIEYADALSKKSDAVLPKEAYDIVLTNPPFTGNIEQSDKSDRFRSKTNKTELLFLELVLDLLVVGGRGGIIVPEGVLFGSTNAHREIRKRLITENQLEAVVSLPAGVFQPYTGVKTSVLIFTKGGHTDSIWFYEVRADGYTLDARRQDRPEENDLWDLLKKYPTRDTSLDYDKPIFREETRRNGEEFKVTLFTGEYERLTVSEPHAWTATAAQVEENDWNLSAARYKPFTLAPVEHEPPAKIIRDLQALEREIQQGLDKLLAMVEERQ